MSLIDDEYQRYGRQLILPEIGMKGQLKLRSSSALIIGVGGLGCPAATYLAGAGVGTIGLVDGDKVEVSNLHRQILHNMSTINVSKVESAVKSLRALNPLVQYVPYTSHITSKNILSIIGEYDVVLDCTDHPSSRYLISDACVISQTPLVSASALRTDGQLMLLNHPPLPAGDSGAGPCYRCVFPKPPPPETVKSCGEGGILGPVVGTMGVLQALETIKILTNLDCTNASTSANTLLIFSAFASPPFRSIKLRGRRSNCISCSKDATINRESLNNGAIDYVQFCGLTQSIDILPAHERISPREYASLSKEQKENSLLIDVREVPQFDICKLSNSVNIPWSTLAACKQKEDLPPEIKAQENTIAVNKTHIYFVCRYGNDSQLAVQKLKDLSLHSSPGGSLKFQDISGGLQAWREQVDSSFPSY